MNQCSLIFGISATPSNREGVGDGAPHVELLSKIIRITLLNENRPFAHQVQSILLRLRSQHRPNVPTRDDVD